MMIAKVKQIIIIPNAGILVMSLSHERNRRDQPPEANLSCHAFSSIGTHDG